MRLVLKLLALVPCLVLQEVAGRAVAAPRAALLCHEKVRSWSLCSLWKG